MCPGVRDRHDRVPLEERSARSDVMIVTASVPACLQQPGDDYDIQPTSVAGPPTDHSSRGTKRHSSMRRACSCSSLSQDDTMTTHAPMATCKS